MIPFVSIVGRGNTGKTTLIRSLIHELGLLGYSVAIIKHDPHDHGEVDREGSDTWDFRKAGGKAVILASPKKVTLFKETLQELTPEEIFPLCGDVDLIILEGYKTKDYPKIFMWTGREDLNPEPSWDLLAIVYAKEEEEEAFERFGKAAVPLFCRDNASKIASFIEERFLKKR